MTRRPARYVVPTERHVERIARAGFAAETRARLRNRLLDALAHDAILASPLERLLALEQAARGIAPGDPLLAPLAREGGAAWARTVRALDGAIGVLRAAGVDAPSQLADLAQREGASARRARVLHLAMQALDAKLRDSNLVDNRAAGPLLARAIAASTPDEVVRAVGAKELVSRFIVDWDGAEAAWWRALDAALARAGGGAHVELPSFESRLDPSRAHEDVLETIAEDLARALDAAPVSLPIEATLGDLRGVGDVSERVRARVELRVAADAHAQARAVVHAVRDALRSGVAIDAIAIGVARVHRETLGPVVRAFDEACVPLYAPRGEEIASAGVVAFAMDALALASRGLSRLEVAEVARSRYIDARKVAQVEDRQRARESILDLADALDSTPSSAGPDSIASLESTARIAREGEAPARAEVRGALARRLATILARAGLAATRAEHAAAARAIWSDLGIDPARSRGARATLSADDAAHGLARAELRAFARDARAWEALQETLEAYEAAALRLGVAREPLSPDAFRAELVRAFDARPTPPAAGRVAAVRIAPLAELAGEPLALLLVIDANEGTFPSNGEREPMVPLGAQPSPVVMRARELARLALAASSAERVVLVHRARDEQGGLLAPAPLVTWLQRGSVPSSNWRASPLDGPPTNAAEARLQAIARRPASASTSMPSAARRARIERAREAFFEAVDPEPNPLFGMLEGNTRIEEVITHDAGGADRPLAVTSLESIARCAFQGFALQVLRARDRRSVREIPDPREAGTLMHAALAAAFTATKDLWPARPRDANTIRARAMDAVDRFVRKEEAASALRRLALTRVRDGVAAVIDWSLAEEAWDFARAEQRFGERGIGSWPALRLDDGHTRLDLRGSIDRVDTAHGRAAVRAIDYKSSRTAVESGGKNIGETVFQIALYARAAADALHALEREGLYLPTQRRDLTSFRMREPFAVRWRELHAPAPPSGTRIEATVLEIVRALRSGMLAPRPRDEAACANCAMSGGCRKPRFAIHAPEDDASLG